MERQTHSQLELFSESGSANDLNKRASSGNPVLTRIWNYEKTILTVISVLLVGIISFSLGVEKGKRIILGAHQAEVEIAQANVENQPSILESQVMIKKEVAPNQLATVTNQGAFTIQVASFKSRANAQAEADLLKKRGLSSTLLKQGNYTVVCVGNFPNKETALPLLSELNKRYRGCKVRRL